MSSEPKKRNDAEQAQAALGVKVKEPIKKKPYEPPQVRALGEVAKITLRGSPPPLLF